MGVPNAWRTCAERIPVVCRESPEVLPALSPRSGTLQQAGAANPHNGTCTISPQARADYPRSEFVKGDSAGEGRGKRAQGTGAVDICRVHLQKAPAAGACTKSQQGEHAETSRSKVPHGRRAACMHTHSERAKPGESAGVRVTCRMSIGADWKHRWRAVRPRTRVQALHTQWRRHIAIRTVSSRNARVGREAACVSTEPTMTSSERRDKARSGGGRPSEGGGASRGTGGYAVQISASAVFSGAEDACGIGARPQSWQTEDEGSHGERGAFCTRGAEFEVIAWSEGRVRMPGVHKLRATERRSLRDAAAGGNLQDLRSGEAAEWLALRRAQRMPGVHKLRATERRSLRDAAAGGNLQDLRSARQRVVSAGLGCLRIPGVLLQESIQRRKTSPALRAEMCLGWQVAVHSDRTFRVIPRWTLNVEERDVRWKGHIEEWALRERVRDCNNLSLGVKNAVSKRKYRQEARDTLAQGD
ncbi:hypothetical protein C8R47DRAFT_1069242 [Mycena vitilis]|nr:hypothetical protein C8R47DRAFT_1069242 [Mycena vitilis]